MTVTVQPRPPRPSEPVDREELEALVEALIEEARHRQRRRRRIYTASAALVAVTAFLILSIVDRTAESETTASAFAARSRPAAAPTTSRIAFLAGVRKPHPKGSYVQTELYVMNADGSGKRPLARAGFGPQPVWSPDGRRLAFERTLGPIATVGGQCGVCNGEIFVIDADGSDELNLTRHPAGEYHPVWSPDGRTIAFAADRESSPGPADIYVMNADGGDPRNLTQDAAQDGDPGWAPDGRRLAFTSGVQGNPGNFDIYVVNVDGSGRQRLTDSPGPDLYPVWSPDGQTIAFMRYVRTAARPKGPRWQKELHVMNADGSGRHRLVPLSNSDSTFSWSPDGRRVVFVSDRDGNDEVYVIDVDGTGLRNLTRNAARDGHPAWSDDGRTIGFISNRGTNRDIYTMNADGSRQRNLTGDLQKQAWGIAWSPSEA